MSKTCLNQVDLLTTNYKINYNNNQKSKKIKKGLYYAATGYYLQFSEFRRENNRF
jgi:hypothetical protein